MTLVLDARALSVERDGNAILENIFWQVREGTRWVLFGPNGSGKTTLLHAITGYLWPTSGTVGLLGNRLGQVDLAALRTAIAMVSSRLGEMVNHQLTGLEVIITGARAHLNLFAPPTAAEQRTARTLSSRFGLRDLELKPFSVMSTGERQRILVARALMPRPRLMILDEPCAGLDLGGREMLLQTLTAAVRHHPKLAIILTTHHLEEVGPEFRHALLLHRGRAVASGPIGRVLTSANLSEAFGVPVKVRLQDGRWSAVATTGRMRPAPPRPQSG